MLEANDSWITIDYADNYFFKKWGAQFWASLSLEQKEQLVCTSKNLILFLGYVISDNCNDDIVKKAQCETIQFIFEFYQSWRKRANLSSSGVISFSVLNFTESLKEQTLPVYIKNLLSDYYNNGSTQIGVIRREEYK